MSKRNPDLHALRCLVTLVSESHVSRAAERLDVTQPAMSAMLAKLRVALGDPILVKTERGMVPTTRASQLAIRARKAIEDVQGIFGDDSPFDPATATINFNLIASEPVAFVLMPLLAAYLREHAPSITVSLKLPNLYRTRQELEEGESDLAVGYVNEASPVLRTRKLRGRTLQVIAAAKHPEIRGAISLEQYTRYPHVCYSPVASGGSSVEDLVQARLARAGLQRSIALHLPSILAMPAVVGGTDLLATIATDVAQALAPLFGLQLLTPPLPLGAVDLSMYWHERTHNNAGCRWLRQVIVEISMNQRSICAQRLRTVPSIKSSTG